MVPMWVLFLNAVLLNYVGYHVVTLSCLLSSHGSLVGILGIQIVQYLPFNNESRYE
jgi:hypothetical protein